MNENVVDLGLSVKWSTCNIGATKPNEFGDFFAWGETVPKDSYLLENYKLCVKVDSWTDVEYSKYNVEPDAKNKNVIIRGKIDNLKKLELDDAAAYKVLEGKWRMPTIEEFMELRNKCNWDWATIDKINGYIVSGKKPGYKDKSIFMPFAYFSQMFFVQPFVRFSIRRIFPGNIEERNERNSNKTVKPADETEAIADVIIREKEIAAGK